MMRTTLPESVMGSPGAGQGSEEMALGSDAGVGDVRPGGGVEAEEGGEVVTGGEPDTGESALGVENPLTPRIRYSSSRMALPVTSLTFRRMSSPRRASVTATFPHRVASW